MKLFLFVLCLIAIANAKYVVQQLYDKNDTKCEKPGIFGVFMENKNCFFVGGDMYNKATSNSTHVSIEIMCNAQCQNCRQSISYPIGGCVQGFINVKLSVSKTLPKIGKKGIYIQNFQNEQ